MNMLRSALTRMATRQPSHASNRRCFTLLMRTSLSSVRAWDATSHIFYAEDGETDFAMIGASSSGARNTSATGTRKKGNYAESELVVRVADRVNCLPFRANWPLCSGYSTEAPVLLVYDLRRI